jgi:single-strand DNA-binding protein
MANFNFNKTILGGKLTADAELKTTQSGTSVTQFTIAVNRRGKDGEQSADFITCVAWRGTAEFITRYFRKGSSICVVGRIQTRSWKDQNGNNRYATEVVVDEAMFVDSKGDATIGQATQSMPQSVPQAVPAYNSSSLEELDDDEELPF